MLRENGPERRIERQRVLTDRQRGCTFTVRQTQTGAILNADGEQTPTGLARKRWTCRRFAVLGMCRLTVAKRRVACASSRAVRLFANLRRERNAPSHTPRPGITIGAGHAHGIQPDVDPGSRSDAWG